MGATAHAPAEAPSGGSAKARIPAIPFTHAAHENMEFVTSLANLLKATATKVPPVDVPARGYVRHLWFRAVASGGVLGPGVVKEDFPFNIFDSTAFKDVGGGEIVNPMTGYELYLINKYGGYVFSADPQSQPDYSAAVVAFNFALRLPFEISASDALGSLSNQNSQSKYKWELTQADSASIYSTLPTTLPTVTVDAYTELWSQPPGATDSGIPILNKPPLLGTTQYWSKQIVSGINAGNQIIELDRRGNQDRMYILIWRETGSGLRADTTFPNPLRFVWDSREQFEETPQYRRQVMVERYGTARTTLDRGVYVFDMAHDVLAHPGGMDDGHLWNRTKSSSRLEFRGNFTAAGTLTILHNDVAPVAVVDQFGDTSGTGGAVDQTV
jgi:hypothetical protein